MPPKQHDISLLFHPKKTNKSAPKPKPTSPRKPPATLSDSVPKEEDEDLSLPEGPYQEFNLMSSALNGWKYDVMKFDSRKPVDVSKWVKPIKLNRKELTRDTEQGATPTAVAPMLGPDGKPVIGMDGKVVMVDAEGRPIVPPEGSNGKDAKGKAPVMNGKKRFQKKTRQVYPVPEGVRQLRKEERYPWVMEDSSPNHDELWVGQLDDVSKSGTHAFFMPAANDVFKFVPAHRWYKFQKKLKHDLPTSTAEVESLYNLTQKRDSQAWLASRSGRTSSASAAPMIKTEAGGTPSLVYSSGSSLGPGGRRLKTVDSGMNGLFDEDGDEDPDARRRRQREYGEEGHLDEQVYEEDFADDEERAEDENDEEAKELEERLKREYKAANKQRDAGIVESDEEEEIPTMSKQAKAMQRLIRNREGNEAYESDEEKNPYASSDEEEEEEEDVTNPPATQPPATQPPATQPSSQPDSRAGSQTPKPGAARPPGPPTESRATSPVPSPNHSGHSIVAKRATGDKIPKPNVNLGSSPAGSRATSPVASSRAISPRADGSTTSTNSQKLKRKAEELPNGSASSGASGAAAAPKPKKRKAQAVVPSAMSTAELKSLLMEWLKNTPDATTRECIHHFSPYLTDQEKKTELINLVKEVAQLKNGMLVLRQRGSVAPASPPAATV